VLSHDRAAGTLDFMIKLKRGTLKISNHFLIQRRALIYSVRFYTFYFFLCMRFVHDFNNNNNNNNNTLIRFTKSGASVTIRQQP